MLPGLTGSIDSRGGRKEKNALFFLMIGLRLGLPNGKQSKEQFTEHHRVYGNPGSKVGEKRNLLFQILLELTSSYCQG